MLKVGVSIVACLGVLLASGAELAGRKMVWAHYVAWNTPDNVSLVPARHYDAPQHDRGADPLRDEVLRALDMGIDGFFNDVCVVKSGPSAFWDLRPFLKAAEGTPFHFGICMDGKTTVAHQVEEIVRMLSVYGDHPNYPKMNGRYVVDTYTYFRWTPEEWAQIRKVCADAGYPLYLIANVETGFDPFSEKRLADYADQFDCAYSFSLVAKAHSGKEVLEDVVRRTAAFCDARGKMYMPCLWPGYYGAWLERVNCFYQPFLGFDTLHRRFAAGGGARTDWLHLTTWNDHNETTLEPQRLTSGNRRLIRAYSRAFKGQSPSTTNDVHFAYLRETVPGTVHRFEAFRPPTLAKGPCTVEGRLRDVKGTVVANLPSQTFAAKEWASLEWLVSTTSLAVSPVLTPEFEVTDSAGAHTVTLPPVFLFAPHLRNPETVKVSMYDRRTVSNTLDVAYVKGVLTARCSYDSPVPVRRATLYRNERPVGAFGVSTNTVLPVFFTGHHTVTLVPEKGKVEYALKSFETNGMRHFSWDATRIQSTMTPGWMKFSARIAATGETRIAFTSAGETKIFSPGELVEKGELNLKDGHLELSPDCTLRDLPVLPSTSPSSSLTLSVWSRTPCATDAFWVQYEFADGTHAESAIIYPFADLTKHVPVSGASRPAPVTMNLVETPVTPDWSISACGQPDAQVFTSPVETWPVRSNRVVTAKVSPLACRRSSFQLAGTPRPRTVLPFKEWPMGACEMTFSLIPHAADGEDHVLLQVGGWQEGPSFKLLADGRLEAAYGSSAGQFSARSSAVVMPPSGLAKAIRSREPLVRGKPARVRLLSDCRKLMLELDGVVQGEVSLAPLRVYGNCQPSLGPDVNGEKPTVAELYDLDWGVCVFKDMTLKGQQPCSGNTIGAR